MKIAFFTDTFVPQVNGVASSIANTAKELAQENHEVLIIMPDLKKISRKPFSEKNVTIVSLPIVPGEPYPEYKLSVLGLPKALAALKKFNPDVIHFHTVFTVGLDAIIVAKILRKPLVGTIHYYFTNENFVKLFNNDIANKAIQSFGKLFYFYICAFYNPCDLRLSPSQKLIKEAKKAGYKKSINYLPNGIENNSHPSLSSDKIKQLKNQYKLKDKVILHFGRISPEKKVDLVVKSAAEIIKTNPQVSLLIIGDGPDLKDLKQLVSELGIEENVTFTGFIEHQKLISEGILNLGDIFVTASPMETQPMVVLEAMSFGLPIVAVREAGMSELVDGNGYLIDYRKPQNLTQKITEILFNEKLSQQMSLRSKELVKRYSIEETTKKLVRLYEEAISEYQNKNQD